MLPNIYLQYSDWNCSFFISYHKNTVVFVVLRGENDAEHFIRVKELHESELMKAPVESHFSWVGTDSNAWWTHMSQVSLTDTSFLDSHLKSCRESWSRQLCPALSNGIYLKGPMYTILWKLPGHTWHTMPASVGRADKRNVCRLVIMTGWNPTTKTNSVT